MSDVIIAEIPLGAPPWPTLDPFLFCVHHLDLYPAGDDQMAPMAPLTGRRIGMDFEGKDGWRMYHGDTVPGFPQHPHRGFETVTLARQGFIDHSDSMGATARFGHGDVQWMTAGSGVVHCEMFPLVNKDSPNTGELFQLWLNLPRKSKMVDPHFTMFWSSTIPRVEVVDSNGKKTEVVMVAGASGGKRAPSPPPASWASDPANDVAIWTITLEAGAEYELPPATAGVNRVLYAFRGGKVTVAGRKVKTPSAVQVRSDAAVTIIGGAEESEVLLLQGRAIGEPVAQQGPFVMNTQAEIQQTIRDYQRTRFGGWPWPQPDPVHARDERRFALRPDGTREEPPKV